MCTCIYTYAGVRVCVCVCVCAYVYGHLYVYRCLSRCTCICKCLFTYIYICTYACMNLFTNDFVDTHAHLNLLNVLFKRCKGIAVGWNRFEGAFAGVASETLLFPLDCLGSQRAHGVVLWGWTTSDYRCNGILNFQGKCRSFLTMEIKQRRNAWKKKM